MRFGEAEAARGVLAIDDDEIEPPAGAQKGNLLKDGGAPRPPDDVADEKQTDHRLAEENCFLFGHDGVQALVMGLIRHRGDFAYPVGDADRMNRLHRAQAGEAPIVIAGAIADAVAAPVEAGERHEQEIRIDGGRSLEGLANGHRPGASRLARPPEAKSQRRPPANDGRQGGRESFVGERGQKQERVGLVAHRMKGRDDPRTPEAREAQALLGEATAESGASRRARLPLAGREPRGAGPPSDRRCSRSSACRRSEKGVKNKARSRDGRWTVIPGAYVSRWEPYAEAHEPRQGQPPWGSYGPEECCPDAPPSSAMLI